MSALALSAIGFAAVILLAALRMPLAFALGIVGAVGAGYMKGWNTFLYVVGTAPFEVLNNYNLSVLPLFVLMGALAVQCGLATDLVRAANAFMGHYRGGLAMGSVLSCAGFGAISGSNLATLSTMGGITIPEMLKHGYSPRLAAASIAAASTLDILIPPSIAMVIYAMMTESSIGRMMAGGIVPGVILTFLFIFAIQLWLRYHPEIAPPAGAPMPWRERIPLLKSGGGVAFVFLLMMGGMYAGVFSPTEAAGVGAAGTLVVGLIQRRFTWSGFVIAVRESVQLSAIIYLILIGIAMFHFFMDAVGLQKEVTGYLGALNLAPPVVLGIILVALVLLGCVMDSMAILFITTPVLFPIVVGLGYDPIWFGVVMVMVIQLGLIHPPFGLNVFILATMNKEIDVIDTFWGCVPFVVADILMIVLVCISPQIILWLPNLMFDK
ncbi:MAG: TRAP transporter large permease [Burkholderiales bacterium]